MTNDQTEKTTQEPAMVEETVEDVDISDEFDALHKDAQSRDIDATGQPVETEVTPDVTEEPSTPAAEPEGSQTETPTLATRADGESEGKYALRQRIAQLQKSKKSADPSEKKDITKQIKATRKELGKVDKSKAEDYQSAAQPSETKPEEPDVNNMTNEEYERHVVKVRAKEAGFLDANDVEQMFADLQDKSKSQREQTQREDMYVGVVEGFIADNPQYREDSQLDSLIAVVADMYNVEGKSDKELRGIFERAHNDLNPNDGIAETIQSSHKVTQTLNTGDFKNQHHSSASNDSILSEKETDVLGQWGSSEEEIDGIVDSVTG